MREQVDQAAVDLTVGSSSSSLGAEPLCTGGMAPEKGAWMPEEDLIFSIAFVSSLSGGVLVPGACESLRGQTGSTSAYWKT